MATVTSERDALPVRSRVVAVRPLLGVPEGTAGRIETVSGLTWIRYWVHFDNDVWLGPVDTAAVVEEDDWPAYQDRRRAEEKAAAARAAEAAEAGEAGDEPVTAGSGEGSSADETAAPAEGAASKIPAALLARSQAAKAKKAAAAGE